MAVEGAAEGLAQRAAVVAVADDKSVRAAGGCAAAAVEVQEHGTVGFHANGGIGADDAAAHAVGKVAGGVARGIFVRVVQVHHAGAFGVVCQGGGGGGVASVGHHAAVASGFKLFFNKIAVLVPESTFPQDLAVHGEGGAGAFTADKVADVQHDEPFASVAGAGGYLLMLSAAAYQEQGCRRKQE